MSLSTFNFPKHAVRHEYPEGEGIQFGGGYNFGIEPILPLQRTFILNFQGMKIVRVDGTISTTANATENMLALDAFYATHRTDKRFLYNHEVFGILTVRFKTAIQFPRMRKGGFGVAEEFEVQLIEAPE